MESLTEIFSDYKNNDEPDLNDIVLPEAIEAVEIEYMIYKLCNGDITKKKWIESELDITDYFEWVCFKKYDNFIETEAIKRQQKK